MEDPSKSITDEIKFQLGDLILQATTLKHQVRARDEEIAQLRAELAKLAPALPPPD